MFLTNVSLKRPVFITVIIIALLALGVISYMGLPMEQLPAEEMQEVKDKVSNIRNSLPRDINEPIVSKYDASASAIFSFAVTGTMSNSE